MIAPATRRSLTAGRRPRLPAPPVAAPAAGSDDGVASIKTANDERPADQSTEQASQTRDPEDAMLDFARCMREHGIDMPDPDSDAGDGAVTVSAGGRLRRRRRARLDTKKFEEANEACRDPLGDAGPMEHVPRAAAGDAGPGRSAFSRCMREHGVDMPDPVFDAGSGGGMVKIDARQGHRPRQREVPGRAQQACGCTFGAGKGGPGGITVARRQGRRQGRRRVHASRGAIASSVGRAK